MTMAVARWVLRSRGWRCRVVFMTVRRGTDRRGGVGGGADRDGEPDVPAVDGRAWLASSGEGQCVPHHVCGHVQMQRLLSRHAQEAEAAHAKDVVDEEAARKAEEERQRQAAEQRQRLSGLFKWVDIDDGGTVSGTWTCTSPPVRCVCFARALDDAAVVGVVSSQRLS